MFAKLLNFFKSKKKEQMPDFSDVHVKLKPIFGIQPKVYLIAIYGLVALILIFLIFFLPGITAGGTYISFTSSPVQAGVWIDGIKAGVTPCEILVKQGLREITITRPFYTPVTIKRDVGGFVFALPFLPRRENIHTDITIENIEGLSSYGLQEFSLWSLVESFSEGYHYPPVLCETVAGIKAAPKPETYAAFSKLLDAALPFLHNRELASDYIKAAFILETRGKVFSPSSAIRLLDRLKSLADLPGHGMFLLYSVLPEGQSTSAQTDSGKKNPFPKTRQELAAMPEFQKALAAYSTFISNFPAVQGAFGRGNKSIEGIPFIQVPAGKYLMGRHQDPASMLSSEQIAQFPHPVKVNSFLIARTEVTNQQFKRFLDETPDWRKENIQKLVQAELVTEDYLKDWDKELYPQGKANYPVVFVSAYAAQAFCQWLSQKASWMGKITVRLPLEAEWEWASSAGNPATFMEHSSVLYNEAAQGARIAGTGSGNIFGISDMSGNVFEWCADWFALGLGVATPVSGDNIYAQMSAFPAGGGKTVRGGSWVTKPDDINSWSRGFNRPYWCTPYLGFRPVIAEQ